MKVGDLIILAPPGMPNYLSSESLLSVDNSQFTGIIVDFTSPTHPKQIPKAKVLSRGRIEHWPTQYCKLYEHVISKD